MASRTNRYRRGEKSTDIRVGYLGGKPSIIANWGGRMYGVPLSLDGAGNTTRDSNFGNIRVKGDAVFDSGASVLRVKGDGISIKESNVEVAKFGATTTIADLNLTGKIIISSGGTDNVCIGVNNNDAGSRNIAIGRYAGSSLEASNTDNIFIGYKAGRTAAHADIDNNIAIGNEAMENLDHSEGTSGTPQSNVAIGHEAMELLDHATASIAIGPDALKGAATGSSIFNVAVGANAIEDCTSAAYNTCVGRSAGSNITSGTNNVAIGNTADTVTTTGTYNVFIGDYVRPSTSGNSNCIAIGQNFVGYGNDFSFGKASNVVKNDFDADATWSRSSDLRKKTNIQNDTLGLSFVNDLRTVTFNWKPANEHPEEWEAWDLDGNDNKVYHEMNTTATMHGLIAQEVKATLDNLNVNTFAGWDERENGEQSISSEMFVYPLIKAVQELSEKLDSIDTRLTNLEAA